jgi:NADH pyrophosphatase NudC (nudix superfamily)
MEMPIIFSDEDLMYLDKDQDNQLRSIRQAVDTLKTKGDISFCKKCGHMMQYFNVGSAKLLQCGFCGNRIVEMVKSE